MQLQNLAGNSRKARGRKFQSPDPQNGDVERPVAHTSRGPWHDKRQFGHGQSTFQNVLGAADERRRRSASDANWHLSDTYHYHLTDTVRAVSWSILYISVASLNSIQSWTGSQRDFRRTDVMCSRRPVPVISLAAAFWTHYRRWMRLSVTPYSTDLQ